MLLTDALELMSKPVFDEETGNMLVSARSARTGVQLYRGEEVGRPEMEWVSVYRDPADVFSKDSLESYTAIPVTMGHPSAPVTSDTWKDVAIGETDGAIKDGDFIRVPFTIRHSRAIKQIKDGTAQISMGYSGSIVWGDGVTSEGEKYDAKVTELRMNHLAIVPHARGGDKLRIGDDANNPPKKEPSMKKLIFDGIAVSIDDHDAVESGVKKLEANLVDATAKAEAAAKALADAEVAHAAALKDANDAKVKAEAEVASLTKELADSKVTPEQMREAAKAYAMVIDAAAKIAPDFKVEDSMTEADIRKGAILSVFGDAYKDKADTFFDALFEVEAAKVKDKQAPIADAYRQTMGDRKVVDIADAAQKAKAARDEMIAGFNKRARADAE